MYFYLIIGLIWLGLAYLVFTHPKWSIFLLLALLPFNALIKTFSGHLFGLQPSEIVAMALWKELIILFLILAIIIQSIKEKRLPFKLQKSDYLILILLTLALTSWIITGLGIKNLVFGIKYDLLFLLFFLAVKALDFNRNDLIRIIKIILISALITGILAIAQATLPETLMTKLGYNPGNIHWQPFQPQSASQSINGLVRISGPFSGPNQLGVYLVFILLLTASLASQVKSRRFKGFAILSTIFLLIPIFLSYSRTAWVSLIIGLFVLMLINFSGRENWFKFVAGILLLGLIIGVMLHSRLGVNILHRHTDFDRQQRFYQSSQLLLDNPFGVGLGRVGPAAQWIKGREDVLISENFYLQIGLELGFLGLAVFLAIMALVIKRLWQKFKKFSNQLSKGVVLAGIIGLIGVLASGFFLHTLTDASLIYTLAIVVALADNYKLGKTLEKI